MENEVLKYSEIEQFRNVIQQVIYNTRYIGKDNNGQPMFDGEKELPKIKFLGTIKTHGTNAGVIFKPNENGEYIYYTQSRTNIITPTKDNAGFSTFINTKPILELLKTLPEDIFNSEELPIIQIYGEFVGKGIQKGVSVSELTKRMVIFGVKVNNIWVDNETLKNVKLEEHNIYNILDFKTYEIEIDFNNPKESADIMSKMLEEVEKECPVGKAFGVSGVGEGIVFKPIDKEYNNSRYFFKIKGDEHKGTSTKEKVPVDMERVNSIKELVETIVARPRLEQGLEYLRQEGLEPDRKNLGTYIKWVYNDVIKEELDTIMSNGFEPKDVSGEISKRARDFFFEEENNNIGL